MVVELAVAGLALSVFSLVVSTVKQYRDTILDKEIKRLLRSLEVNQTIYRNCIEQLLVDVVREDEVQQLLDDPGGPAWEKEGPSKKLEVYLDDRCSVFLDAVEDIREMIVELHKKFPPEPNPSKRRLARFIKGLYNKPRGEADLDRLSSKVQELERLINGSSRLTKARHLRYMPVNAYKRIHDSAIHLYEALADGWVCECETQHHANLLLETRRALPTQAQNRSSQGTNQNVTVRFRFLFSFRTLSAIESSDSKDENQVWRELEIEPMAHDSSLNRYPEIRDLCDFIGNLEQTVRRSRDCLGYLFDRQTQRCYGLFTVVESVTESSRTVSQPLAQILAPPGSQASERTGSRPRSLSKGASVRLAVVLSSTLLQLHSTKWLQPSWSKDEIGLLEPGHMLKEKRLYLMHKFMSRGSRNASVDSTSSEGTALEKTISNTSGIPWGPNETLYNLGVILLELSLGQSIDASDIQKVYQAYREVGDEVGSKYQDAVYSCIHCNFDLARDSMGFHDPNFQQNVLDKVIRPLEECSENFPHV